MNIQFATCSRELALKYLSEANSKITKEKISKLLYLVKEDILRVQDPVIYGSRIGIIYGKKYSSKFDKEIQAAIIQLKEVINDTQNEV